MPNVPGKYDVIYVGESSMRTADLVFGVLRFNVTTIGTMILIFLLLFFRCHLAAKEKQQEHQDHLTFPDNYRCFKLITDGIVTDADVANFNQLMISNATQLAISNALFSSDSATPGVVQFNFSTPYNSSFGYSPLVHTIWVLLSSRDHSIL